jgi:hypothetical protein
LKLLYSKEDQYVGKLISVELILNMENVPPAKMDTTKMKTICVKDVSMVVKDVLVFYNVKFVKKDFGYLNIGIKEKKLNLFLKVHLPN